MKLLTLADAVNPALGAYQAGQKRAQDVRRQQTLAEIGLGLQQGQNPNELAGMAIAGGAPQAGFRLADLAMRNKAFDRQVQRDEVMDSRADRNFQFQQSRAAASDARADAGLDLRRQQIAATQANTAAASRRADANQARLDRAEQRAIARDAREHKLALRRLDMQERKFAGAGQKGTKPTVDQAKSSGFARRTLDAEKIIANPKMVEAAVSLDQTLIGSLPVVGNKYVSKEYQQFDQARRNFVNAILRRESGAVISDAEFDNANRQYFPQYGDSAEVIKQKAANRRSAIQGLVESAGPLGNQFSQGQSQAAPPNIMQEAQAAIQAGADPAAVRQRLQQNGFNVDNL